MQKVVALCLLRLLPRGGKNFRVWFGKRLCKREFERQTRSLRAWRVLMMRTLEMRKQRRFVGDRNPTDDHTWLLRDEIKRTVRKAFAIDDIRCNFEEGLVFNSGDGRRRWLRVIRVH